MIESLAANLRHAGDVRAAMLARRRHHIAPRRQIGVQRPVRAGMRLAQALAFGPDSRFFRRFMSMGWRSTRIARRLCRQTEHGFEFRNTPRQHLDLTGQCGNRSRLRQNQADQCFLIERFNRFTIHPELETARPTLVKTPALPTSKLPRKRG